MSFLLTIIGTPIPYIEKQRWKTSYDNQTEVDFKVYQGEDEFADNNFFLDQFTITGLPALPFGEVKFEVCFEIDSDGMLLVSAKDVTTGKVGEVRISTSGGKDYEDKMKKFKDIVVKLHTN